MYREHFFRPGRALRRGHADRQRAAWLIHLCLAIACLSGGQHTRAADTPRPLPEPGFERGYASGQSLHLGGYLTLRYSNLDDRDAVLDLRDLALLATWKPSPKWLAFTEIEIEEGISLDADGVNTDDAELALERLYLEYNATPALTLRAGKFLTPFGRWNELHADPLVWTISRPLTTVLPFAGQVSGLAARGFWSPAGGGSVDYIIYADASKALDPAYGDVPSEEIELSDGANAFENAVGGQLRWHLWGDRAELGLSYANARLNNRPQRRHIIGVDGLWRWRGAEFTSEAVYRQSEADSAAYEWGAFVQGVVPIYARVYGVARYERYYSEAATARLRLGTLGLAYRLRASSVFKLEYRLGDDNDRIAADGFLAGFSTLF